MTIEAIAGAAVTPKGSQPAEQVERVRKTKEESPEQLATAEAAKEIQPEELLTQIKALTEEGLYSVRFENDKDLNSLIVKVIDQDSGEVVREIPPESIRDITKHLNELVGNMVDTTS